MSTSRAKPEVLPRSSSRSWMKDLLATEGSLARGVLARLLAFEAIAAGVIALHELGGVNLHLPAGVHETSGAVIGLVLAYRTNTAYNRYWEGRSHWGAIVNASRNAAQIANAHARVDEDERRTFLKWIATFAWTARRRLRGEAACPELEPLLTHAQAEATTAAPHPPLYAAQELSRTLARWAAAGSLDPLMAVSAQETIAKLVDALGGCEKIAKTPLPLGHLLLMERFIALYLSTLPFMLVTRIETLTLLVVPLIAYPILLLDALGATLDNPFGHDPSHLALTNVCLTIQRDLLGTSPPPDLVFVHGDERGR